MAVKVDFISSVPLGNLKVWVLAPYLNTKDNHIDYYYDFTQSIAEYTKVFATLQINWQWQPVTMDNYQATIEAIIVEKNVQGYLPLIFNLCDGDEVNGTPGISVIQWLEEKGLIYTGSNEYFYRITTSKLPMKQAFDSDGVSTADWEFIEHRTHLIDGLFDRLGSPIIVKPAISGGSMGVGIKNVVETPTDLANQIQQMFDGYRGWNLAAGGIIAESFISGPEFTTLLVGSANNPDDCWILDPVERIFHPSLQPKEKFLSFDRLWEIYEEETPMPESADFYQYASPDPALQAAIKQISLDAYRAVKGTGYTRVDIRMDQATGKLYVLEVNAQCGLSEDENYTSIGAILRISGVSFTELIIAIINDAFRRRNI